MSVHADHSSPQHWYHRVVLMLWPICVCFAVYLKKMIVHDRLKKKKNKKIIIMVKWFTVYILSIQLVNKSHVIVLLNRVEYLMTWCQFVCVVQYLVLKLNGTSKELLPALDICLLLLEENPKSHFKTGRQFCSRHLTLHQFNYQSAFICQRGSTSFCISLPLSPTLHHFEHNMAVTPQSHNRARVAVICSKCLSQVVGRFTLIYSVLPGSLRDPVAQTSVSDHFQLGLRFAPHVP